jgi:hypothetical protein
MVWSLRAPPVGMCAEVQALVVVLLFAAVVFAIVRVTMLPGRYDYGWASIACVIAGTLLVPAVARL